MKLWNRVCTTSSKQRWISILVAWSVLMFSHYSKAESAEPIEKTHSCYLKGISDRLQCGKLAVPENPNKPNGKVIDIHFTILPAVKNTHPQQAMLGIAGGPGQSAIDNAALFGKILSKVRENRDILLIDQRGTGRSNILSCTEEHFSALAFNDENVDMKAETEKCLAQNKGTDVTQYGSDIAVTDFEAVREYLGYQKLHLYGISYGTRMAQLYMRHFPQSLETVTLDGVVPMQQSVLAIGDAINRAVKLMLRDCKQSTNCEQAFPELAQELQQVSQRLQQTPYQSAVSDPYTGEPTVLLLTDIKFKGSIRLALYSPNTRALLPYAIHQAAKENFQPILGLYSLTLGSLDIALGMHSSVVCGEDFPRLTDAMYQSAKHSFFGADMLDGLKQGCAIWKMPTADADFSKPIASDIPTLLLSGELDPATPPSWGDLATAKLTNSVHFVAPYATHGVAAQSCGRNLIADLVKSGSVKELDGKCLDKDVRRSFYVNASSVEVAKDKE